VASRRFAGAPALLEGTSLKYRAGLDYALLRIPEKHLTLAGGADWELGRAQELFSKMQASLSLRWRPYVSARLRAGKTLGQAPFDELFTLGIERDNDLWLRAHAGTRAGKKGSAPMGHDYLLANWDFGRDIYRHPLFTVEAGPFVDAGRIRDPDVKRWLIDCGMQVKLRMAGGWSVAISYGRSLRGPGKAFYVY